MHQANVRVSNDGAMLFRVSHIRSRGLRLLAILATILPLFLLTTFLYAVEALIALFKGYVSLFNSARKVMQVTEYDEGKMTWEERHAKRDADIQEEARRAGFSLPTLKHLKPIPPDSNPFNYDLHQMGSPLVRGWVVMHPGWDNEKEPRPLTNVDLYNTRTGQAFRVMLNTFPEQLTEE